MGSSGPAPHQTGAASAAMPAGQTRPLAYDPTHRYPLEIFDVQYRRDGDEAFAARVYQPQGPGPFSALVDIHGGQWTRGD